MLPIEHICTPQRLELLVSQLVAIIIVMPLLVDIVVM
jgi:hypothetical protein